MRCLPEPVTSAVARSTAPTVGRGARWARADPPARSRRRCRLTVDSEQPSRRAIVSRPSSGWVFRIRTTSSWSTRRPPTTPARLSKSSGCTSIPRSRRIRPRWAAVVPAVKPATSCSTTAAYRQSVQIGQPRQTRSARPVSDVRSVRKETAGRCGQRLFQQRVLEEARLGDTRRRGAARVLRDLSGLRGSVSAAGVVGRGWGLSAEWWSGVAVLVGGMRISWGSS